MRNHQRIRPAIILLLALVPAISTAGWIEEFEGYDVGENLLGQDGWVGAYRVDRGDAYVSSDFAYVGLNGGGIRVVDVADPSSPVELDVIEPPVILHDVQVVGGYASLAEGSGGFVVVKLGCP